MVDARHSGRLISEGMKLTDPVALILEYARFPSVSTDSRYGEGMKGARDFVSGCLAQLGFKVQTVPTARHPIIYAHRAARGANAANAPHILIYGHYDVQPAEPLDLWATPAFEPQVRGDRVYGRGTADNKGPQCVQIAALAKVLAEQPDLPLEISWVIEGEEEIGSPNFLKFLHDYKGELSAADLIIFSDTGCPSPEQMAITVGLRGLMGLELKVKGASQDLHSGVHGGCVHNPIAALSRLLASLHNEDGTVNVPGFYDEVVPMADWEREQLQKLPTSIEAYQKFLGVKEFHTPPGYSPFEAVRACPTLEFNGIGGGYQGEGDKTVIPAEAFVKITCRMVANQDPDVILERLVDTLHARTPKGVQLEVHRTQSGPPYLVTPPMFDPKADQTTLKARAFKVADEAIGRIWGRSALYLREGGSVPIIGEFRNVLGLDSLMLGLFTSEDNLHAPNESMHLGIIERAVELYAELFRSLAANN